MPPTLVPVAQYLRMSTEHQQYSPVNQAAKIREYADAHYFKIVKTYSDAGKSGLLLKNRPALASLLTDVVSGTAPYRAILVYDISRWGRFQDTDEAAHYEYLCKSAGVPIHYCAEQFTNDGTVPSLVMKALKRAMAGEYSRELGVKVYAGQKRLAEMGFHIGGAIRYGLRRMLVSADGRCRFKLRAGQRKSLTTDRIILVPGPRREQRTVRQIFDAALSGTKPTFIARRLNASGVPYLDGRKWNPDAVSRILRNPKYAGCSCWGRTAQRLSLGTQRIPPAQWVIRQSTFPAVVSWMKFQRVQEIIDNPCTYSDQQMLDDLRRLLSENGRLCERIINEAPGVASATQYGRRFGSVRRAYQLIGYEPVIELTSAEHRSHSITLRNEVIRKIRDMCGSSVRVAKRDEKRRPHLIVGERYRVCVIICPQRADPNSRVMWDFNCVEKEMGCMKLACALDTTNTHIIRMFVLRGNVKRQWMKGWDDFLKYGSRLRTPAGFVRRVIAVARRVDPSKAPALRLRTSSAFKGESGDTLLSGCRSSRGGCESGNRKRKRGNGA